MNRRTRDLSRTFLSRLGALLLAVGMLPVMEVRADDGDDVLTGQWHELDWMLADHVLTVSGEGDIVTESATPKKAAVYPEWSLYAEDICEIIIQDGVTGIQDRALSGYPNLTRVTLPESLHSLAPYALAEDPQLSEIIGLENVEEFDFGCLSGTAYIGEHPFVVTDGKLYYAEGTDLNVPEGVTEIMPFAFGNLTGGDFLKIVDGQIRALPVEVSLPEGVKVIHENAFAFCVGLTSVNFPASLCEIGAHAFYDCVHLTDVTLGKNVKTVGEQAFFNCKSLQILTLENKRTKIGKEAYGICCDWEKLIEARHAMPETESRRMSDAQYASAMESLRRNPYCLDEEMASFAVHFWNTKHYGDISFSTNLMGISDPAYLCATGAVAGYADSTAEDFAEAQGLPFYDISAPPLAGDVNLNGHIDIMDVILLNKYVLGAQDFNARQKLAADHDGDGEITTDDAFGTLCVVVEILE
ncbi:MAG: leucine-rich repeat protein [Oscillospiraceae bacterium]|nr:leucine-rich repeat protein [Oscillospiraceae bacterium]